MNEPYVKQYDSLGVVTNPIENRIYPNKFPNRRQRRIDAGLNKRGTVERRKGNKLVVLKNEKWLQKLQKIGKKTIMHFVPANPAPTK